MSKFTQENQDAIKIIFYAVVGIIIVGSIITLLILGMGNVANDTYYDEISETNLEIKNTGSITENLISFIGLEKINDNTSISTDLNAKSANMIRTYFTYAYPKSNRLSYKNGSSKQEGDTYTYEAQLDSGEQFYITIVDLKDGNFKLNISDKNNEILSYETAKYSEGYKDIRSLADKLLPKVFNNVDGLSFSLTWKNNKYNLNINHCNNEKMVEKAKEIARNWIKSSGYNPDDVEFYVPYMCDGGYN